jgi:hypothetical protein
MSVRADPVSVHEKEFRVARACLDRLMGVDRMARVFSVALVAAVAGCGTSEPPRPLEVEPVVRDVPESLRGQVGTEVVLRGVEPSLVSGLGLVVGLKGTGGEPLPDTIAATMKREMGLRGISTAGNYDGPYKGMTPDQLLRDKNVAVVLVQAAVPPGLPRGATFDVFVKAINASSLEGGLLWTTDMRVGPATVFGAVQTHKLGEARGPIFINPFAEPGQERLGVTQVVGRVLDGGVMTDPFKIEMVVESGSHQRSRSIVSAINSRFPMERGDTAETARGRSGSSVELVVPQRYRERPSEFIELVKRVQIDQRTPEVYAREYARTIIEKPALGEELSWALEALGPKAVPSVRTLYDASELVPRMAGLRAGAALNDGRAAERLIETAREGRGSIRTRAITLLGRLDGTPQIDTALQSLQADKELAVRVAAYEALVARTERAQLARFERQRREAEVAISRTHLEVLASSRFSARSLQGIERRTVAGKFVLDIVPFGEPLLYITQQGQPRVVVFGVKGAEVLRPRVASAWSDRFLMSTEAGSDEVRLFFRPLEGASARTASVRGGLVEIIETMARDPKPEDLRPGLGMSYSQVVGALHAIATGGGTLAALATESDRLKAELIGAEQSRVLAERPERPGDEAVVLIAPGAGVTETGVTPRDNVDAPTIVPIAPPGDKK